MPPPKDIVLEDSWVLEVSTQGGEARLVVEAALTADNPHFYTPPKAGERHSYARVVIRIKGDISWEQGPHAPRAVDASGELDYGDLGSWHIDDEGTERLVGEWGTLVVSRPTEQEILY